MRNGIGNQIRLKFPEMLQRNRPPNIFQTAILEEGVELNVQSVQVSEQIRPEKIFRCVLVFLKKIPSELQVFPFHKPKFMYIYIYL